MFPESCIDSVLDDKTVYTTMIRVSGTLSQLGYAFVQLFNLYGWHRAILLTDRSEGICLEGATSFYNHAIVQNITVVNWLKMEDTVSDEVISNIINQIKQQARSKLSIVYSISFTHWTHKSNRPPIYILMG